MRTSTFFAAAVLASRAACAGEPPVDAAASVCRPTFQMPSGPNAAGTAFLLGTDGKRSRTLLVTAHHLFRPDGGLKRQLAWHEIASVVGSVRCVSIAPDSWHIEAGRPTPIKVARSYAEVGPKKDLAVFDAKGTSRKELKVARSDPKAGDPVWLVARAAAGAPAQVLLHKARVIDSDQDDLAYVVENKALGLAGTSGAPVVDASGSVVGVHYGGGRNKKGDLLGFATARHAILESLALVGPAE